MTNNKVIIRIDIKDIPLFGTWKWTRNDYNTPLVFDVDNAKVRFYIKDPTTYSSTTSKRKDLEISHYAYLEIEYINPNVDLISGLEKSTLEVAEKIYHVYESVIRQFEILCRTIGKMEHYLPTPLASFEGFFESEYFFAPAAFVTWTLNSGDPKDFRPNIPTGRKRKSPLFKKPQLLTRDKWKKMQQAIDSNELPQEEIVEVLRIQSKFFRGKRKVSTLEIAILLETLLREHAYKILIRKGFSRSKIKNLNDELTFNSILNLILPLSLTKSQLKKLKDSISSVNTLRKIRNDIVHGNITEDEIDESAVKKGIKEGLKLVRFLINQQSF